MWAIGNLVWYILFTPLQPTTDGLLSTAWRAITPTNVSLLVRENPDFIISLIVVIIMGILAQWQVNRTQDKAKKAEDKAKELEEGSKRDIAAIYKQSNEEQNKIREQASLEMGEAKEKILNLQKEVMQLKQKGNNSAHQQQTTEIRNLAKMIDIDISTIDIAITPYYGFYFLNSFPDPKAKLIIPPDPFYDTENGLYFKFNYDISRFDFKLSSKLHKLYNDVLMMERDRQSFNALWNNSDAQKKAMGFQNLARMQRIIKFLHDKSIPEIREGLKEVYEHE